MNKSNQLYSYERKQEKPVIYTGIGRRLPPTPLLSPRMSFLPQTAPTTANSSPRITKLMDNSTTSECCFNFQNIEMNQISQSYDDNLPINTISRRILSDETKLNQERSHSSTPQIATKSTTMNQQQLLRSQSFRHRSRASVMVKRHPFEDSGQQVRERRRSTPNILRHSTLHPRHRLLDTTRIDVWPKPRRSMVEDRFLNIDSEDYTRVREFNIDEKGTVVSRGDSFRLKSPTCYKRGTRNRSNLSNESTSSRSTFNDIMPGNNNEKDENNQPSTSTTFYEINVIGSTGVGKSTLIGQFMTSDHRNTYATDIEKVDNTVSIIIGDKESELTFHEIDLHNDNSWLDDKADIHLLIYSIDSKSSFKQVMDVVDCLRESTSSRHTPIVMAANKVDLERKRAVSKADAKNAAMTYGFAHYEVSVALNLDVDDLLVGLIAEIKQSLKSDSLDFVDNPSKESTDADSLEKRNDFKAAIRRFSKRRRQQMGSTTEKQANKCTHFKSNLIERFRNWRRLLPNLNY
uniref:Small monomeric GTPase n=1 Tax=Onchocerca volvulus TaxID=6282 RepID=A0A8R1TRL8_ONCVO